MQVIDVYICVCTYASMTACMHACIYARNAYKQACMHVGKCARAYLGLPCINAHMYTWMCALVHAACVHQRTHACLHAYMHARMHA